MEGATVRIGGVDMMQLQILVAVAAAVDMTRTINKLAATVAPAS